MDYFYSRCLLCTCRPDVTPHLNIFSEAGKQLQLAEKINKHLKIQIVANLPQNVCHSCMEKLEATSEFVTSSQQASITLLQMKQQDENVDQEVSRKNESGILKSYLERPGKCQEYQFQTSPPHTMVKQENSDCSMTELDSYQPATTTIDNEMDIKENEMDKPASEDFDQADNHLLVQLDEEPSDCNSQPNAEARLMDLRQRDAQPVKDQFCQVCGQLFTKAEYPSHLMIHPQRVANDGTLQPVGCSLCHFIARNKFSLLVHINSEHLDVVVEPLPFCCDLCDKEFAKYKYVMQHFRMMHTPRIRCDHCGKKVFENKMSRHLKLHQPVDISAIEGNLGETAPFEEVFISDLVEEHGIKQEPEEEMDFLPQSDDVAPPVESRLSEYQSLQCEVCSFYTDKKAELAAHMQTHQTPLTPTGKQRRRVLSRKSRILHCSHCKLKYGYPEILAWHVENCHGPDALVKVIQISDLQHSFQCVICESVFKAQEFIVSHLSAQHRISNLPFKCKVCGRSFVRRDNFLKHKIKFNCEEEGNSSTNPGTTNETEGVKCKMCDEVFKSEHQMESHISTFHALKYSHMYKCCHCEESFRFFPRLKKHCTNTHPGKFVVQCEICKPYLVTFKSYHGYRLHLNKKHKSE